MGIFNTNATPSDVVTRHISRYGPNFSERLANAVLDVVDQLTDTLPTPHPTSVQRTLVLATPFGDHYSPLITTLARVIGQRYPSTASKLKDQQDINSKSSIALIGNFFEQRGLVLNLVWDFGDTVESVREALEQRANMTVTEHVVYITDDVLMPNTQDVFVDIGTEHGCDFTVISTH